MFLFITEKTWTGGVNFIPEGQTCRKLKLCIIKWINFGLFAIPGVSAPIPNQPPPPPAVAYMFTCTV